MIIKLVSYVILVIDWFFLFVCNFIVINYVNKTRGRLSREVRSSLFIVRTGLLRQRTVFFVRGVIYPMKSDEASERGLRARQAAGQAYGASLCFAPG